MHTLARHLNEIAVALTREYLTKSERVFLLSRFYLLLVRAKFKRKRDVSLTFLGFRMSASSLSNLLTIVREVFLFGDYYFKAPTGAPVIVDCGGNIGIATIFFKWLYPQARVISIEPSQANAAILRKNVEENGLADVTVIEAAASDEEGIISLWESQSRPGSSTTISAVHATKAKLPKHSFVENTVTAIKLSSVLPERVDLLKMDVEGAEGRILKDLAESGSLKRIENIIFEYHNNEANTENDLSTLLTLLKENGLKTIIFNNEIGPSSEVLASQPATHFLIRASRRATGQI